MILNLPVEILLNICSHLKFKDKLDLKVTCRQLNKNITNAVLYETLYLLEATNYVSDRNLREEERRKVIQILQDDRLDGSLVKILYISEDVLSESIRFQLLDLFPNVKRIITSEDRPNQAYTSSSKRYPVGPEHITQPLARWRNTIEMIVTRYDWYTLRDDLLWSKYPRLTELDLDDVCIELKKWLGHSSVSFFKNAPLLKKLTLRDAHINLEVLEAIHTGFPHLESLRLFSPHLNLEQNKLVPQSIPPASSVLYFGVLGSHKFNINAVILDYILKKYTHLQQLVFDVRFYMDYFKKTLSDFEKSSYFGFRINEDEIAVEIARSEAEFPIYNAIESNFFSKLPITTKTITLKINNIDNAVAALAESNSKIIALDLLDYEGLYPLRTPDVKHYYTRIWQDPNMLENFKKLTSLKILKIPLGSSALAFTQEYVSSTVTRLVIGLCEDTFSIEWVLSRFPALDELEINPPGCDPRNMVRVSIKERDGEDSEDSDEDIKRGQPIKEHPKLRVLTINKCILHPSFFSFIKRAVPHLNELNLKMGLPMSPEKVSHTVDLSDWNLNKCDLSFIFSSNVPAICCIATIQNVSNSFEISPYSNCLAPVGRYYKCQPKKVWIEVIADHIKHLKIIGFPVIKIADKIVIDITK